MKMTKHPTLLSHRIFTILLFIGLAWGRIFDRTSLSYGIGDSETGISILGLSLSKHLNEKNTLFLGAGTVVYVNPICIGIKEYIKKTNKQSSYTFFSIQYTISSKNHIVPTIGLISERILRNSSNNIKFGVMTFLAPVGVGLAPILRYQHNF